MSKLEVDTIAPQSGTTITVGEAGDTVDISNATLSANLNATNLTSGTIPDARFPATLPAVNGSQLTGIQIAGGYTICDPITVTNTDTFALTAGGSAVSPESAANCLVSLNGILQAPISSYTISGSNIIFASALVAGSDVIDFITVLGTALNIGTPSDGTVGLNKLSATGTKDATTFLRGDNTFASAQGIFESQLFHVRDEKASGTVGGASTAGSYQTRTLNTVMTNEITGASLSSNQITLPSGTYFINARANARAAGQNKTRLRNITDSTDTIIGSNQYNTSATGVSDDSTINGRFTIGAQKTFELQSRVSTSQGVDGYGLACSFSDVEVYAEAIIWKVS